MGRGEISELITQSAKHIGIDSLLALAIAEKESSLNPFVVRFEPAWRYFVIPRVYAKNLGLSYETEMNLQATSFGCLQVMGSVCRELQFKGLLTELIYRPEVAILLGCQKILELVRRYPGHEEAVVSAYNAGSIRRISGAFVNQKYVNQVMDRLKQLRLKNGGVL
jgi:soluble lytic murein transglycosylase-like protein